MSEIVERVARAINPGAWSFHENNPPDAWSSEYGYARDAARDSLKQAHAAIEAMREATKDLIWEAVGRGDPDRLTAAACWIAALDAALNERPS